jgi:hypothetical protein
LDNEEKIVCLPCEYHKAEKGLMKDRNDLYQAKTYKEMRKAFRQAKFHIREMVQIIEMLSWANYEFTKRELEKKGIQTEPGCDDLARHYTKRDGKHPSGNELFPLKWPSIWNEIISRENRDFARSRLGHKPDIFERYEHYVFFGGLRDFWNLHEKEFLLCDIVFIELKTAPKKSCRAA